MGTPHRVVAGRHVWELGMVDDYLGPGDAGVFVVAVDPAGRVRSAEVVSPWDVRR